MSRYRPLKQLFLTRMRTFYREPEAIFWVYVFPVILTIGLGIAFRNRPPDVIAVDIETSPQAERIKAALDESELFVVHINDADACSRRLRYGKTSIVVKTGDTFEYRYDPTRPESTLARAKLDEVLQKSQGRQDAVAVSDNTITEPGARYIDFLVPGLLGMNLMGGGMWGVGFVITDMRVKKLLKRFVATPMRRPHFMIALIGGRMFFMLPEILALLGAGWLLFGMRIEGSILSIVLMSVIGALSFAGLGLLVASRAKKIETISGLTNLVMLPMWLFSGVFFSYDRFPEAFQPFIQALPLTQLNDALRSIVLEGASIFQQGSPILVLAAWGGISFALALKLFRWT